jgi:hypothetical protein
VREYSTCKLNSIDGDIGGNQALQFCILPYLLVKPCSLADRGYCIQSGSWLGQVKPQAVVKPQYPILASDRTIGKEAPIFAHQAKPLKVIVIIAFGFIPIIALPTDPVLVFCVVMSSILPRSKTEPHWKVAHAAISLRMDEPCLHVSNDHFHEGKLPMLGIAMKNFLVHNKTF